MPPLSHGGDGVIELSRWQSSVVAAASLAKVSARRTAPRLRSCQPQRYRDIFAVHRPMLLLLLRALLRPEVAGTTRLEKSFGRAGLTRMPVQGWGRLLHCPWRIQAARIRGRAPAIRQRNRFVVPVTCASHAPRPRCRQMREGERAVALRRHAVETSPVRCAVRTCSRSAAACPLRPRPFRGRACWTCERRSAPLLLACQGTEARHWRRQTCVTRSTSCCR